jgi:threonine dehydrogenase-like Zn-dependent dehydrogenase
MGVVDEIGPEVHEVQVGDKVVIPFNICCGHCSYCTNDLWSQCDRSNPNGEIGAVSVTLNFLVDMMEDRLNLSECHMLIPGRLRYQTL